MNEFVNQQRQITAAKSWAQDYINAAQFTVASEYELARLVELSAIVFACVQFRSRNVSRVKFLAYDGDTKLDDWHPAQRAVSNLRTWLLKTETALSVYGDSLSQILLNKYHMPLELKFINNQLWDVNTYRGYTEYGGSHSFSIANYSSNFDMDGITKTTLYPRDVVYLINAIDMFSDYAGLSPLEAAYLSGATGVEMSQTQLYTFVNRAIPALIIQPDVEQPKQIQQINGQEAANALATLLRRLFSGAVNAGKTLVQPYRWNTVTLQTDFDKLGMSELRADEVNQVITAFELRQSLILSNAANYATARQDAVGWADDWLLPRTQRFGETIADQLAPFCPDVINLRIVPDEESLPYLEDKKLAQIEADTQLAKSAIISLGELQSRAGETPEEGVKDLYWYEGIGWLPLKHFPNAWTFQYTTAPSALNTGALPDDAIPFDSGVTEQTLEEQAGAIEELQAQADLQQAEADNTVADAQAQAIENAPPETVQKSEGDNNELYASIDLANDATIAGVVDSIKADYPNAEWTDPATWHITLVYAPDLPADVNAGDVTIDKLKSITTHSIASFPPHDNMPDAKRPLLLLVNSTPELLDVHETVYNVFKQATDNLSEYSAPDAWNPHITLAYIPATEDVKRVPLVKTLTPQAVQIQRDDFVTVTRIEASQSTWSDDDIARAQRELKQFSKVVQNKGVKSAIGFTFEYVPENVVKRVTARLEGDTDTAYGDIFAEAREWVADASKSIQSTRLNFENDLADLIDAARNGNIDRRRFGTAMRNIVRTSGTSAYTDGLIAGGVTDGALSDEDKGEINRLVAAQSVYITEFANQLFSADGITDAQANQKPTIWYNKSIAPFYDAGLASADANGNYEWVYGDTEHCRTCQKANGQIHRLKAWRESGILPQSDALECKGYNCKCRLVKTSARARGRLGSLKAHDHNHAEIVV